MGRIEPVKLKTNIPATPKEWLEYQKHRDRWTQDSQEIIDQRIKDAFMGSIIQQPLKGGYVMPEKNEQQDTITGISNKELLDFLKGLSDHSKKEIDTVHKMYMLAATLIFSGITLIASVGIFFTYKNASDIKQEARETLVRSENQMKTKLGDMQELMDKK